MNRSERRKQIRVLEQRMRVFKRSKMLHESKLLGLNENDKALLKKGEHPDKETQRIYNTTNQLIQEVAECKAALELLKSNQQA